MILRDAASDWLFPVHRVFRCTRRDVSQQLLTEQVSRSESHLRQEIGRVLVSATARATVKKLLPDTTLVHCRVKTVSNGCHCIIKTLVNCRSLRIRIIKVVS